MLLPSKYSYNHEISIFLKEQVFFINENEKKRETRRDNSSEFILKLKG